MKAPKLKNTKKQDIKQQKKIPEKSSMQTKLDLSESVQQSPSQLENYKAFFQYLLSNDDDKLADES